MPNVPKQFLASEQMKVGHRPFDRLSVPAFSAPVSIRAPQIKVNQITTPVYEAEINRTGNWFAQKALLNFGDTVVDVVASMADTEAALLATEKYAEYRHRKRQLTHDPKTGFMLKKYRDATTGHQAFQQDLYALGEEMMNSVPPRVKLKLNPMIQGSQNQTLDMASQHAAAQYNAWKVEGQKLRYKLAEDSLKDLRFSPNEDIIGFIQNTLASNQFSTQLEYEKWKDGLLVAAVKHLATLDVDKDGLESRYDALSPHMSSVAEPEARRLMLESLRRIQAKEDKAERDYDKIKKEARGHAMQLMWQQLLDDQPWDPVYRNWIDTGILTPQDIETMKNKFTAEAKNVTTDIATWSNLLQKAEAPDIEATDDIILAAGKTISIKEAQALIRIDQDSMGDYLSRKRNEVKKTMTNIIKTTGQFDPWKTDEAVKIMHVVEEVDALFDDGKLTPADIQTEVLKRYISSAVNDLGPIWDGSTPADKDTAYHSLAQLIQQQTENKLYSTKVYEAHKRKVMRYIDLFVIKAAAE